MDNSAWSLASLCFDEEDIMCFDPVAVAQAINRAINKMTDGEVAIRVLRHGLNIRSDAGVLRDRLERHQMRRHFGCGAASWNPVIDERSEILEPRHISSSPPKSSNFVGNVLQARVFEIPTSTGIFRPNVSAISDLSLERRSSTVAADEISDRSQLNHQPRALSTGCPLRCLCTSGSSCFSPRSMDVRRMVSVPISVPSCSTAESAPIHARPTCSTFFPSMPTPSLEAVRIVSIFNEKFNAAPAAGSSPSLTRSCSRLSFIGDNNAISPVSKLSPSLSSSEGFVRYSNGSYQSELPSYRAPRDCKCSMTTKQREDSCIKFKEMLSQLKPPLRLGKQLTRPCRTSSSRDRPYPTWEVLGNFRKWQQFKRKEFWLGENKVYKTPPPPDELFFPLNSKAVLMLRRQAKLASVKLTGSEVLPINSLYSLAAVSPVNKAKADSSPIASLRVEKVAKMKKARHPKGLCKRFKQPKVAKAEAKQFKEIISPVQEQEQLIFKSVSPQARTREIRRRKNIEPCFRCSQVGHWQRECVNATGKQSSGQLSQSLAAMTAIEELEDVALVKPSREAGYARPGCWNCREFGHGRTACPYPRRRICYMCGQADVTIATCRTCCQEWGQRQLRRLRK